jgi:hypothetical protein
MRKNTYIGIDAAYEEQLVLETLKELPTIRDERKRKDELFTRVMAKLPVEERIKVFLKCVEVGHLG